MITAALERLGNRLLAVLVAGLLACGSTEPGTDGGGSGGGSGGGGHGSVPAELVGSWYYGSVSPTNYYNPGSGEWSSGYGEGMFYTFNADASFEFGYEVQAGSYGCTNTVMWYKSGEADADPSARTITVSPRVALLNSRDNCRPEWNYEKPIDPSPEQLGWRFGQDEWGYDALFLTFYTGEEVAFYRWAPGAGLRGAR